MGNLEQQLQPDVCIIGAGPAGSCAAAMLARAGHSVTVIEKAVFPRFAIGESLLPQCMELLQHAGLLEAVEAQGYQVKRGAMFRRGDVSSVVHFSDQFHDGYDYTYHVPRAHFDNVLAEQAAAFGATYLFGHGLSGVDFSSKAGPVLTVEDPGGAMIELRPKFVLDASGYGHVLPRHLGLVKKTELQFRSASFAHLEGDAGDPDISKEYIVVNIHEDDPEVWCWSIPFSNQQTSFGVVAKPEHFSGLPEDDPGAYIKHTIESDSTLKTRYKNARLVTDPRMMGGFAHSVSKMNGEHYAILGNSGEFLDPIFSSGVTIALKSAVLASELLIKQFDGEAVDWEADFSAELMRGIDAFKTYVKGWYTGDFQTVLFSEDKNEMFASQVCSILAGYVWDKENPLAVQHERGLQLLAEICAV